MSKESKAAASQSQEEVIRKLKLLSTSQTTFLKAHLHKKITAGSKLVQKTIDVIGSLKDAGGDAKSQLAQLKDALAALKLHEIDVDDVASEIALKDEISLLRESLDKGLSISSATGKSSVSSSSVGGDPLDKDRIKALEKENSQLRNLLEEAKQNLQKSMVGAVAPPLPPSSGSDADTRKALEEITDLKSQVSKLQSSLREKDSQLTSSSKTIEQLKGSAKDQASAETKALQDEVTRVKKEVDALHSQLKAAAADAEAKLVAKTKELTALADKRVSEAQTKLEAEKEEMMEALSQEVEEIEQTKKAEIAALNGQIDTLKRSLDAVSSLKKTLQGSITKIASVMQRLSQQNKALQVSTKKDLTDMSATIKTIFAGSLVSKMQAYEEELKVINGRYKKEMSERKRLHNMVQELKGNIRVFLRCRPATTQEVDQLGAEAVCVSFPNPGEIKVFNEKNREKVWEFDEVFNTGSTQEQVYNDVSDLVVSVLDGYNVCIFAYGQTGSGKTFTMSGPSDNRGVNTRALNELFTRSQDRGSDWSDTITVSFLEVYNEEIRDLMVEPSAQERLEVRQGPNGNHVPGLTTVQVNNLQQVIDLIAVADRHRSQTATNMNEHSSRSHMMMTVTVVSENRVTGATARGKLNLVDLAGSERLDKSGATGQAMKEAQNINKSLSALGDVIAARAQKQAHVPFRNSTLTYLLQDSISQDSKTLMIVCISPMLFNSEESFCSLNFAARVRSVELGKVTRNVSGPTSGGGATSAAASSSSKSDGPSSNLTRPTASASRRLSSGMK